MNIEYFILMIAANYERAVRSVSECRGMSNICKCSSKSKVDLLSHGEG
jgi:hypothetical protein